MKKQKMMSPNVMTFREGCEAYLLNCRQRNLREATIRHYRQSYAQFYKHIGPDMPLKEINAQVYDGYVRCLLEKLDNDVSVNSYLRDLITTPVISEKYGYSIRINESRLLPEEITRIGAFHRQKLKKAVITLSVNESYELNDSGCFRIRRLEEDLYQEYLPKNYDSEDVITYHWVQNREENLRGQFNFYYSISQELMSSASMFVYLILLLVFGVAGNLLADVARILINKIF